jgi:hypothetical protein
MRSGSRENSPTIYTNRVIVVASVLAMPINAS